MKFEQALRAMRRGETVRSGYTRTLFRLGRSGANKEFDCIEEPIPNRPGEWAGTAPCGMDIFSNWVIVRKKKRPDKPAPKVERDVFKDPRCEPDKGLNGGDVIVHPNGDTKRVLNVHGHEVYYDYRFGSQDNRTFITSITLAEWADLANKGWTVISRAESK